MPVRTDARTRRLRFDRTGGGASISVGCRVNSAPVPRKRSQGTERPRSSCSTVHGSRSDRAHERRIAIDKRGPDKCWAARLPEIVVEGSRTWPYGGFWFTCPPAARARDAL